MNGKLAGKTLTELLSQSQQKLHHVLRAQDFKDKNYITELFLIANWLEENSSDCMRGKILVWYGAEASTRTRLSFGFAARKLGGAVEAISSSDSSQEKGESIEDTIKSIATMGADVIVLRHPDEHAVWRASLTCKIPLINGGSGKEHHPTQALLDIYTIFRTVKKLDGLSIALIGDLAYSRTTNSLIYLLSKFEGVTAYLVSPEHLRMKGELAHYLVQKGMKVVQTTELEPVIGQVEVVYQTRAQKERTADSAEHLGLAPYVLTPKMVARMQEKAVILHPLPRNQELPREIDSLPQARYFDQMYYGRLIRQALLAKIFG